VLPDAAPAGRSHHDLRSVSGVPARNLSFYPTPDAVTRELLRDVWINEDSIVLEPSAGTGNMARMLLSQRARVHAVEIDPDRVQRLRGIQNPRLVVTHCNFLGLPASPIYTHVVMNPPFYGTHWMEHVVHAFDFLAPGGTLCTVLPVTADLGESSKHKAFREWATPFARCHGRIFTDLPEGSFAESGTRINTVALTLHKPRVR
jgi:hypothetical protein